MPRSLSADQRRRASERQRQWASARRDEWIRANGPCAKCGSCENLEVDHIDRAQKTMEISKAWSLTAARRVPELAKCQVLCKPCHDGKCAEEGRPRQPVHGTRKRYEDGGCRCDLCRAANATRARAKRANKRAREQMPLEESA